VGEVEERGEGKDPLAEGGRQKRTCPSLGYWNQGMESGGNTGRGELMRIDFWLVEGGQKLSSPQPPQKPKLSDGGCLKKREGDLD